MSRLLSMLAVAALGAAVAQPARAATVADDRTMAADAVLGVLQQGKGGGHGGGQGGGGVQEAHGGHGQGGGSSAQGGRGQGGGQGGGQARPSQSGQGNGSSARSSGQGSGRSGGNGGSARSDNGGGRSSGDARESRGNSGNAAARSDDRTSRPGNSANASGRSDNRGNSANAGGRGNSGADRLPSVRSRGRLSASDVQSRVAALPEAQRRLANSTRAGERMAVGAIARGHARGLPVNAFDVRSDNDRVRILNRRGDMLFDMDDRRAGELGGWQMRRLGDQYARPNAPAFCRSGEGHPVWGRQWCLDKGFGLGSRAGTIWSRGTIGDIIFRNPDYRTRLERVGLLDVLGAVVLNRLGLQSVAMGYDQPLTGYWVADPSGPYLLRVNSGPYAVAEFYDSDRDNRPEVLYVVQPVW